MAIIYSYPVVSSLNNDDQIILSRMSDSGNPTKSVTLSTLKDFVTGTPGGGTVTGTGTTHKLPVWTDGAGGVIGDSIFTQDAGATNVTIGGDVKLADNDKILLGTGDDFELYFDATNGVVKSVSNIELLGNTITLYNAAKSETLLAATNGGSVDLYYDNTKQFETTSTGVKSINNIELDGDLIDINGNSGTAGQILSSLGSGNGVDWVDATNDVPYVDGSSNRIARTEDVTNGNTSLGYNALEDIDAAGALYNTALGTEAGTDITTGDNNTAIGYRSLYTATTQNDNTAVGYLALTVCTGEDNVAVGSGAGQSMTSGDNNVAIGYNSSQDLTTGSGNVTIGQGAGGNATNTDDNIAIGRQAMASQVAGDGAGSGQSNVAIGTFALQNMNAAGAANVSEDNVAIGYAAGQNITTGRRHVFIGSRSGEAASTNNNTVSIGYEAAKDNTANELVSIGYQAGYSNTSGTSNTNVGDRAGRSNLTGTSRTMIGHNAGYWNTASSNTFVGALSGFGSSGASTGSSNTAVGQQSLNSLESGLRNVALGNSAGADITTGDENVCIGNNAGSTAGVDLITGDNNVMIGYQATSTTSSVSNEFTLGNSSIATLRCQQTSITSLSDRRDKTSIEDIPYGLDFVDSLQPKRFVWDNRAETKIEEDENGNQVEVEYFSANKGKKDVGFIAQDLQTVDDDWLNLVYDSNPEKLEATYGRLIPVLVKAIKELKARVEALEP